MYPTLGPRRSRDSQFSDGTDSDTTPTRKDGTKFREIRFNSAASLPSMKRTDSILSQTSIRNSQLEDTTIWEAEDEYEGECQSDKHSLAKYTRERLISQQRLMFKFQNQEHQLRKHMGKAGLIKVELDRIRVMKTPEPIEDETFLELEFLNYEASILHPVPPSPVHSRRSSEDSSKTLTDDSKSSRPPSSTRSVNLHSENCFACKLARRESNISDSSNTSTSSALLPPVSRASSVSAKRRSTSSSKSGRLRRRAGHPDEPATTSSGSAHSSNLGSETD